MIAPSAPIADQVRDYQQSEGAMFFVWRLISGAGLCFLLAACGTESVEKCPVEVGQTVSDAKFYGMVFDQISDIYRFTDCPSSAFYMVWRSKAPAEYVTLKTAAAKSQSGWVGVSGKVSGVMEYDGQRKYIVARSSSIQFDRSIEDKLNGEFRRKIQGYTN